MNTPSHGQTTGYSPMNPYYVTSRGQPTRKPVAPLSSYKFPPYIPTPIHTTHNIQGTLTRQTNTNKINVINPNQITERYDHMSKPYSSPSRYLIPSYQQSSLPAIHTLKNDPMQRGRVTEVKEKYRTCLEGGRTISKQNTKLHKHLIDKETERALDFINPTDTCEIPDSKTTTRKPHSILKSIPTKTLATQNATLGIIQTNDTDNKVQPGNTKGKETKYRGYTNNTKHSEDVQQNNVRKLVPLDQKRETKIPADLKCDKCLKLTIHAYVTPCCKFEICNHCLPGTIARQKGRKKDNCTFCLSTNITPRDIMRNMRTERLSRDFLISQYHFT